MFSDVKLGIAPINWTNDDDPSLGGDISFEQCICEMHEAGFVGCEVGNKFPRDTDQLHAHLKPFNLQVASAWMSTYFTIKEKCQATIDDFKKHMLFLKAMGAKVIVVCECGHAIQGSEKPLLSDHKPLFSTSQWQALQDGLHRISEMARENNMWVVYHAHMGTGVQTEDELHTLMGRTDPGLLGLLLDTGHIHFSGADPAALARTYGKRIKHVHLKDLREKIHHHVDKAQLHFMDAVRAGVFTVPGDGCIDFTPIFKALSDSDYHGWFIVEAEQDPKLAPPLAYAKKTRQYIRQLTGL